VVHFFPTFPERCYPNVLPLECIYKRYFVFSWRNHGLFQSSFGPYLTVPPLSFDKRTPLFLFPVHLDLYQSPPPNLLLPTLRLLGIPFPKTFSLSCNFPSMHYLNFPVECTTSGRNHTLACSSFFGGKPPKFSSFFAAISRSSYA